MIVKRVKSFENLRVKSSLIYIWINKCSDAQCFFHPHAFVPFLLSFCQRASKENHLSSVGASRQMKQTSLTVWNLCQSREVRCRVYAYDRDLFQFFIIYKIIPWAYILIPKGGTRIREFLTV